MTRADVDLRRTRGQPYRNAIDLVVAAKKEVSRLWDQSGPLYPQLFSADLTGVRVCRLVRVFRVLNAILDGSERAETAYARRMFFRHGRFFIMAFVAQRCSVLVNRPGHDLTADEKTELSRATNELAEAIYAESVDRQWEKGYRAIFQNLGDSQPLTDKVIRRLTTPPAPAPVPTATQPGIVTPETGAVPAKEAVPGTDGPTTQPNVEQGNAS
jgi:hypothetical protein